MRSEGERVAASRTGGKRRLPNTRGRARLSRGEDGFTLVELLVVVIVLPLIVGAIAIAFVAVVSLQSSTASRTSNAADAQTLSASFETDIHAAGKLTTDPALVGCGTSSQQQVLAVEWQADSSVPNGYQNVASYVVVKVGTSVYSLVRQLCTNGTSTVPTSSSTVAFNVPSSLLSPTVTVLPSTPSASAGWVSASNVTNVSWTINEVSVGSFPFTVVAVPTSSSSTAGLPGVVSLTNNCQLATPGTGYYAGSLCFVDFSSYTNALQAASLASPFPCQPITSGIPGTADTLSFNLCISVSTPGASGYPYHPSSGNTWASCPSTPYEPVCDATLPTYYDPSGNGSEAFLGNNGFYTGVGGRPALYQTVLGSTVTLTFNNIVINGPTGPITGWELVTGDAESTDQGEGISWASSSTPTFSGSRGAPFSLLPDNPGAPYGTQVDDIGNACATTSNVTGAYLGWPNTDLVFGSGNASVTCGATVSSDKTGTVMLELPSLTTAPTSMQVVLDGSPGNGHQAVFVGVMLP